MVNDCVIYFKGNWDDRLPSLFIFSNRYNSYTSMDPFVNFIVGYVDIMNVSL